MDADHPEKGVLFARRITIRLRESRATVMAGLGRTAMPTALPKMVLPATTLPAPDRLSPKVLSVKVLAARKLRLPPLIWTPSE